MAGAAPAAVIIPYFNGHVCKQLDSVTSALVAYYKEHRAKTCVLELLSRALRDSLSQAQLLHEGEGPNTGLNELEEQAAASGLPPMSSECMAQVEALAQLLHSQYRACRIKSCVLIEVVKYVREGWTALVALGREPPETDASDGVDIDVEMSAVCNVNFFSLADRRHAMSFGAPGSFSRLAAERREAPPPEAPLIDAAYISGLFDPTLWACYEREFVRTFRPALVSGSLHTDLGRWVAIADGSIHEDSFMSEDGALDFLLANTARGYAMRVGRQVPRLSTLDMLTR
jgi:hypothetical protein